MLFWLLPYWNIKYRKTLISLGLIEYLSVSHIVSCCVCSLCVCYQSCLYSFVISFLHLPKSLSVWGWQENTVYQYICRMVPLSSQNWILTSLMYTYFFLAEQNGSKMVAMQIISDIVLNTPNQKRRHGHTIWISITADWQHLLTKSVHILRYISQCDFMFVLLKVFAIVVTTMILLL